VPSAMLCRSLGLLLTAPPLDATACAPRNTSVRKERGQRSQDDGTACWVYEALLFPPMKKAPQVSPQGRRFTILVFNLKTGDYSSDSSDSRNFARYSENVAVGSMRRFRIMSDQIVLPSASVMIPASIASIRMSPVVM